MKKILYIFLAFLCASPLYAKKDNAEKENQPVNQRISNLSADEKRQFEALSEDQKKKILKGNIDIGFNEWMVKLAWGEPYYGTEHHPIYKDYEQVWLYTKTDVEQKVNEETISQNGWPTLHRTTETKTCQVGNYFLLWDRGVVDKIVPLSSKEVYGTCTIKTQQAYLPIVNGKPVEPNQPQKK